MKFNENLREARKQHGMSQEELAEHLEVSRQAVSKWENGSAYPELDKLMILCDLFHCTLDDLMKKDMSEYNGAGRERYDNHHNLMSKAITCCTVILLLGVSMYSFMEPYLHEDLLNAMFMMFAIVAILGYVYFGMRMSSFDRKYPDVPRHIYTDEELETFDHRFTISVVVGVGLLLLGVILQQILERASSENFANGTFLLIVSVAVGIFVYMGMQKTKYDKTYPEHVTTSESERKIGKWCGVVMLISTAIYLFWSFLWNAWEISWIVFAVGGLCCGIIAILFQVETHDQ